MEMIWLCMCSLVCALSIKPTEVPPPISAFKELCSKTNLPCLVHLVLSINYYHNFMEITHKLCTTCLWVNHTEISCIKNIIVLLIIIMLFLLKPADI